MSSKTERAGSCGPADAAEAPLLPSHPTGRVLVVDDEEPIRQLIAHYLAGDFLECVTARNPFEALNRLKHERFSLVISDIRMPGMSGMDLLQLIRRRDPDVAVILITGAADLSTAVEALRSGASDFLGKPFDTVSLRHAVRMALERQALVLENRSYQAGLEVRVRHSTQELDQTLGEIEDSYRITLEALVAALDAREHETRAHSQRVREYSLTLARRLNLCEEALLQLGRGALLHDVGKIGVPDAILLKPGPLTPGEWGEMRRHPRIGHDILAGVHFLSTAADIVLYHQERWDGKGYPGGVSGADIPLGARIFAVADTLDAMTSDRPYRKALPFDAALEEIRRNAGTQFDPHVVEAFFSLDTGIWQTIHDDVGRPAPSPDSVIAICPT